jgi:CHAD domain-containing protein
MTDAVASTPRQKGGVPMSGLDSVRTAAPPLRAVAELPTGGTQPPSPGLSLSDTFAALAGQIIDDVKFYARAIETHENAAPEALHQLRVSLRRLRALWWAYQPLLEKRQCRIERDQFRQLADAAGETRNWDILRELVPTSMPGRPRRLSLTKAVDGQRALAALASREAIARADIEALLDRTLKNSQEQLAARGHLPTLEKYAQKRVSLVARNLRKAGRRATRGVKADYASLHRVRISAKKLRYLTEFFSPILSGRQDVALESLSGLQEALGKLNDIVVSEALVARHSVELGSRKRVRKAIQGLEKKKKQKMRKARVVLRGTLKALHRLATAESR